MKRVVVLLAIACAFVGSLSAGRASAQDETVFLDPAIATTAPEIVNGVVVTSTPVEVDGYPHTIYQVEVTDALVGERTGTVLVQVPGGTLSDGTTIVVSHQPQFEESDQVQLALGPTEIGVDTEVAVALSTGSAVLSVYGGMDGTHWFDGDGISSAQAAGDYVLHGSKWASFPINYRINPANSGQGTDTTIVAIQRAFDRWEDDPGSNLDFSYGGSTTLVDINLGDGVNIVSWVQTNQRWLAEATWSINHLGQIIGFDIRVNRNYPWAAGAVPGQFDIESVLAHEIGHAVGLDHTPASSELMFASVQSGFVKPLGLGDRGGARALYPAPNPVPAAPTIVGATGSGLSRTVSWAAPPGDGFFTYSLQRSTNNGQTWIDVATTASLSQSVSLSAGVHQFRVRAANTFGSGPWGYSIPIGVAAGNVRPLPLDGQIERLYQAFFRRSPDATGFVHWRFQRASGMSLNAVADSFASSAEFQATYGSLSNGAFVDLVYQNVLGRSADAQGPAFWVGQLAAGVSRGAVMTGFSESPEMVARTGTVAPTTVAQAEIYRLYLAFFLRVPDAAGSQYWVGLRQSGSSLESIAAAFAGSTEFISAYGSLTDYRFVELAYANVLARTPDAAGAAHWRGQLAGGLSRGSMMVGLSESAEFIINTGSIP